MTRPDLPCREFVKIRRTPRGLRVAAAPGVVVADMQRWGFGWRAGHSGWIYERLNEGTVCHGSGMRYPTQLAAVYAFESTVWLQMGDRVWDASTIAGVRQVKATRRSASYQVTFADGATKRVRYRFPASVVAHRLIDPTYDEIDSWSDDIMKLFPYTAADGWQSSEEDIETWVPRVVQLWSSGFRHSGNPV